MGEGQTPVEGPFEADPSLKGDEKAESLGLGKGFTLFRRQKTAPSNILLSEDFSFFDKSSNLLTKSSPFSS